MGDFRRRDALTAVFTVALGTLLIALGVSGLNSPVLLPGWDSAERSPWWHLIPLGVGGIAMLGKRRRPLAAFSLGTIAVLGDIAIGGSLALLLVWWDLLYAVGLYASIRTRNALTVLLVLGTLSGATLAAERNGDVTEFLLVGLQLGAMVLVPLWWAWGVRQGHELAAVANERVLLEEERAVNLGRMAELDRAEAVSAERTAMARDLHDVISSHLSAIAIHSAAALAAPPDGDRDRAALRQVRAASVASLGEMRTMISLLRSHDSSETLARHDGLAALPELVRWAGDAGLEVAVIAQDETRTVLSTSVDLAALRIIREAFTNALKYGTGTARLALAVRDAALNIEVTNPVAAEPTPSQGGGTGLVSMRERATALGGAFVASGEAGEWRVRASLPLQGVNP